MSEFNEAIEQYKDAVFRSPIGKVLHEEALKEGKSFIDHVDDFVRDKLEREAPFFMQEYAYGDEPHQKAEVRYGPYIAEVAMRDREGAVRFINRVGIDVLLPARDSVDIVSCLVLAQSLSYLLDIQDDEHDSELCEKTS
jgi:hypothetical protein